MKLIPKKFYQSEDVVKIAKKLLGKEIHTDINGVKIRSKIVETEAYRGPDDKGCHAYNNRYTERTRVMYEEGGVSYVYIAYGMHNMLNVVTARKGQAHAILIRAIEPINEINTIQLRRNCKKLNHMLTGGPGKVCQALDINKMHNALPFYDINSPIKIYDNSLYIGDEDIVATPRVGMSIHVGEYSNMPWRFYIRNNPFVSKPLFLAYNW
jgi:DNA-3-methyladenine glycosylase